MESVPFPEILSVLEAAGYVMARVAESHYVFVHGDKKRPMIFLPVRRGRIRSPYVLAARRLLDESGAMSAKSFDSALRRAS